MCLYYIYINLTVCPSLLLQPTDACVHSDLSAHFLLTSQLSPSCPMACSVWQKVLPASRRRAWRRSIKSAKIGPGARKRKSASAERAREQLFVTKERRARREKGDKLIKNNPHIRGLSCVLALGALDSPNWVTN